MMSSKEWTMMKKMAIQEQICSSGALATDALTTDYRPLLPSALLNSDPRRFTTIISAGTSRKSAARANRMVMAVKKPNLTRWFKDAVSKIKKPVHKTREVINRAWPVPVRVLRIA